MRHLFAAALALSATTALGAEVGTSARDEEKKRADDIETIVVTATHRETTLLNTPGGIGAVTGEAIAELGAKDMGEIFRMVSGVNMAGEGAGQRRYTIRGITSQQTNSVRDVAGSSISSYLDGASVTSALGPAREITGNLFDIDRVEILKGPQGTLFGEGAQAGAIRYIYKQPDASALDFAFSGGAGVQGESDDNSYSGNVMVNVPLIADQLAARMSLFKTERAGWIDNRSNCTSNPLDFSQFPNNTRTCLGLDRDVNSWESTGGRVALKYDAENWWVEGAGYWVSQQGAGTQYTPLGSDFISDYREFNGVDGDGHDDYEVYRLTGEADLGFATLTGIASVTHRDTFTFRELFEPLIQIIDFGINTDNTNGRCAQLVGAANCPAPTDGLNQSDYGWDGWTETDRETLEVRLVSNGDTRLRWTGGLWYKHSKDWSWSGVLYRMRPGREVYSPLYFFDSPETSHETRYSESAIFGEVSYDIVPTVELTVGARAATLENDFMIGVHGDRIASDSESRTPDFARYAAYVPTRLDKQDEKTLSPKVVVSWRPEDRDLMAYASYATGFRPGNVNRGILLDARGLDEQADAPLTTPAAAAVLRGRAAELRSLVSYESDTIATWELGVKTTLFDDRVQLQASAYYNDWQDVIQRSTVSLGSSPPPGSATTTTINQNQGAAEVKGFDLDASVEVLEGLRVALSGSYTSTELTDASFNEGKELIFNSPYSGTLSVDYERPMGNSLIGAIHVDHSQFDSQWFNPENTIELPSYHITNLRVSLRQADDSWVATFWVKNLTDEIIVRDRYSDLTFTVDAGTNATVGTYQYLEPPQSLGVDFSWQLR